MPLPHTRLVHSLWDFDSTQLNPQAKVSVGRLSGLVARVAPSYAWEQPGAPQLGCKLLLPAPSGSLSGKTDLPYII